MGDLFTFRIIVLGAVYGVLNFAAGFMFGAFRELVLIPAFAATTGHLIEFALMLIAVGVMARLLVRRTFFGSSIGEKLALGVIGVIILVAIESTFAMIVMGMPLATYLAGYDVSSGALFPFGLLWMAVAPMMLGPPCLPR